MTYLEFRDKYYGQYVDYDGSYGCQCWDLAQKYFTECLGVPEYVLGGCDLVSNMLYPPKRADLDTYFDEVDTTKMIQGDVVIWEYGHIAIYDNWSEPNCYFFSQNPNPCEVIPINRGGIHAFRLKSTKPVITPNVEKDTSKNQVEVNYPDLRVRTEPSLSGEILGMAKAGYYDVLEQVENDDYTWFKIGDDNYIAYSTDWATFYPKEEVDYKKLYMEALKEIEKLEDKITKAIEDLQ